MLSVSLVPNHLDFIVSIINAFITSLISDSFFFSGTQQQRFYYCNCHTFVSVSQLIYDMAFCVILALQTFCISRLIAFVDIAHAI